MTGKGLGIRKYVTLTIMFHVKHDAGEITSSVLAPLSGELPKAEVSKRTISLGAKRRRDIVRRHFERSEDGLH